MPKQYAPPFTVNATILSRVAQISELLGRWSARTGIKPSPTLRRVSRIRSVQASLAIESNRLTLEQVTAVLEGRSVLAPPHDVQEVRNAFVAYEHLSGWRADSADDLLAAHGLLMAGLVDDPGRWRTGGVGIYRGDRLVHMAPPASRVPKLMADRLAWVARSDAHPLVTSCVFHCEFEFIHPFADGNGRLGRLWQTLILSRWQPALAWLPVETVIRDRQNDYYGALAAADAASDASGFVAFMLGALAISLDEAIATALPTDQVTDQVSDPVPAAVVRLLAVLPPGESLSTPGLMRRLGLRHRPSFRTQYLSPALAGGWVEMSQPDAPRSPTQTYRRPGADRTAFWFF